MKKHLVSNYAIVSNYGGKDYILFFNEDSPVPHYGIFKPLECDPWRHTRLESYCHVYNGKFYWTVKEVLVDA